MLEVEIKIKTPHENVISKLEEAGFTRGASVYEKDIYFNGKQLDLKVLDQALRIRESRDLSCNRTVFTLNFKGPKLDQTTMTREETEFEVPSFSHAAVLLHGLGFFEAGMVEKTRNYYKKSGITCCLDTVTGLGEYLEMEIMAPESDYDHAIAKIKELLQMLGLSMEDTIRHSYLSMLMK